MAEDAQRLVRPADYRQESHSTPPGTEVPIKLAIHAVTTFRWPLLEDVTAARDFGLTHVGLWRRKIEEFGRERSIELIRDSGLRVSSLSWAGGFTGLNGPLRESIADARDAIQLARNLGAQCLVVAAGGRGGHILSNVRNMFVDALCKLREVATAAGVTLVVQPMHRLFDTDVSFLGTLDAALDVIETVGPDSVKLALDVHHLSGEPRLLDRLPGLVPHLALVQITDGKLPARTKYDRCQLGDGDLPIREIVQTLRGAGFDGCFEIALWSRTIWRSDYRELIGECLARFGELCESK